MKKYEVRCCQPQKLLGWLYAPEGVRQWRWQMSMKSTFDWSELVLRLETINHDGRQYLAVKAEGVPIETLRRIPGFEEACKPQGMRV